MATPRPSHEGEPSPLSSSAQQILRAYRDAVDIPGDVRSRLQGTLEPVAIAPRSPIGIGPRALGPTDRGPERTPSRRERSLRLGARKPNYRLPVLAVALAVAAGVVLSIGVSGMREHARLDPPDPSSASAWQRSPGASVRSLAEPRDSEGRPSSETWRASQGATERPTPPETPFVSAHRPSQDSATGQDRPDPPEPDAETPKPNGPSAPPESNGPSSAFATAQLGEEQALLVEAWSAFARGDLRSTRDWTLEHTRRFPRGALRPEREAIEAMVECIASGSSTQAHAFMAAYPRSLLVPRIQEVCSQKPSTPPPGSDSPRTLID